ncbi:helix-hairpin-helix domain-containing protein [Maribacter sp. IgM3_T14_3]|uniref:helix-hairpin-helix domain-containing protein n=1 Tax=Maribacter sp. IgM3_T14_3 TaxID=3415140 RepID=UPI003C6F3E0F
MKNKANIQLDLSDSERKNLRKNKVKKSEILEYACDELAVLLNVSEVRAKEIYALAGFQQIPSIGIEFAKDLIFLGYYKVEELNGKSGAELTDHYEKKKGYKTDPCVEDQFRLAVDFAKNKDYSKKWWDFTNDRKEYRTTVGYPKDRPKINWIEALNA